MKTSAAASFILAIVFGAFLCSCSEKQQAPAGATPQVDLSAFLGQWTFDFGKRSVGWLQIRQEEGFLDADLMWGSGGVFFCLPYVYMAGDKLVLGRNARK